MSQGWDESAQAWIDVVGTAGDWGRRHVLDEPMLERVRARSYRRAVDIGCGEGRFSRMLRAEGVSTTGIDPTEPLIEQARRLDPSGDYQVSRAEALEFADSSFDLAVAYLSLIDVPDLSLALREAYRVLENDGRFLIANLQGFNTASVHQGWTREPDGSRRFCIDHYLQERALWVEWQGIRIQNWHRPMQAYMRGLLDAGFELEHFSEPALYGVDDDKADRYRRVPNFLIMEWRKAAPR